MAQLRQELDVRTAPRDRSNLTFDAPAGPFVSSKVLDDSEVGWKSVN